MATTACRQLLGIDDPQIADPIDAPRDTTVLRDGLTDVPIDAAPVTLTFTVGCGAPRTANALCQMMGYPSAGAVRGHGWWQCGGTQDRCLGGFVGLGCPDWCATNDCVNSPFCGAGHAVVQLDGNGTTLWNALDYPGGDCANGNPGWTLRAVCIP